MMSMDMTSIFFFVLLIYVMLFAFFVKLIVNFKKNNNTSKTDISDANINKKNYFFYFRFIFDSLYNASILTILSWAAYLLIHLFSNFFIIPYNHLVLTSDVGVKNFLYTKDIINLFTTLSIWIYVAIGIISVVLKGFNKTIKFTAKMMIIIIGSISGLLIMSILFFIYVMPVNLSIMPVLGVAFMLYMHSITLLLVAYFIYLAKDWFVKTFFLETSNQK